MLQPLAVVSVEPHDLPLGVAAVARSVKRDRIERVVRSNGHHGIGSSELPELSPPLAAGAVVARGPVEAAASLSCVLA